MLTKTPRGAAAPTSARARAGADTVPKEHPGREQAQDGVTTAATVVNEKGADWVPLSLAPFYYSDRGFLRSPQEWDQYVKTNLILPLPKAGLLPPTSSRAIEIALGGVRSIVSADSGVTVEAADRSHILFVGTPTEFWRDDGMWTRSQPDLEHAASRHCYFLRLVLMSLWLNLGTAIEAGAARLMARKNSVLAPFEHIAWDQWQYFRLEENDQRQLEPWHHALKHSSPSSSATGPAGEKLYAIHIAPGTATIADSGGDEPEKECLRWLLGFLMQGSPNRPPKLVEDAISRFPGLSKRGFQRSLLQAQRITGNTTWGRGGRPRKPPQSPHKNPRKNPGTTNIP